MSERLSDSLRAENRGMQRLAIDHILRCTQLKTLEIETLRLAYADFASVTQTLTRLRTLALSMIDWPIDANESSKLPKPRLSVLHLFTLSHSIMSMFFIP
jgi:hypothetical protein